MSDNRPNKFFDHSDFRHAQLDAGRHPSHSLAGQTPNGLVLALCVSELPETDPRVAEDAAGDLLRFFQKNYQENPYAAIFGAFEFVNRRLYLESFRNAKLAGASLSATLVLIRENLLFFGSVGNSSLYWMEEAVLEQVENVFETVVHTQENAVPGYCRDDTLINALGGDNSLKARICKAPIVPESRDLFVMCSPAFFKSVPELQWVRQLRQRVPLDEKVRVLAQLSRKSGKSDGSLQMVQYKNIQAYNIGHHEYSLADQWSARLLRLVGQRRAFAMLLGILLLLWLVNLLVH